MQHKKMISALMAGLLVFMMAGCGSVPSDSEIKKALEDGTIHYASKNINLVAVAASAGDSEEMRAAAEEILNEKGVTYTNIIPDPGSDFYKNFICEMAGFPMTYIVDREGNMIGAPLVGVVKNQEKTLMKRLELTKK